MNLTTIMFLIFIPLLSIILLAINLIFAPHNAYQEKNSAFECGFHSFLGQNRTQFSISFFIFALLFLLFDLEILLVYPYTVSAYTNELYGLITMLIFFFVLTLGFAFEWGKKALNIDTRQIISVLKKFILTTIIKCHFFLLYLFYLFISFIFIYFTVNVILIILYKNGIIDIPFLDRASDLSEPLYMNRNRNPNPYVHLLDTYPEYKDINDYRQLCKIQNEIAKQEPDLRIKQAFNKPECYKEILDGLQRMYDSNKPLIENPSKIHHHINYTHQVKWMQDLEKRIDTAKIEYNQKLEQYQINRRNYVECVERVQAIGARKIQVKMSQS